jgi:hyperosmotically inducible protein
MKRTVFFMSICMGLVAGACQRPTDSDSRTKDTTGTSSTTPSTVTQENRPATNPTLSPAPATVPSTAPLNAPVSASDEHAADNTGRNERDRSGATATSGDQGESEADRHVSQQIRKAVVDDSTLSMTAHNVKIITNEGVVTLRGPVRTSQEKSQIAAIAQRVAGVKRVDNQLELATK